LLYNNGTARSIRFGVGGGEKFRINSDGNTYVYQTLILNANNASLLQRDIAGTVRNLAKIDSSDNVLLGDTNLTGQVFMYPANYAQVTTNSGNVQIGPQNPSWNHFYTDRPGNYFNTKVTVDTGIIESYDEDLQLRRAQGSSNRIDIADGYTRIITGNSEKFRVTSDGRVNYNGYTGVDHITVRSNGHTNSSSAATFFVKFCTIVVDSSPSDYNGLSLSGTLYNGDNNHGNTIDWSIWFNSALDSAAITHGGYMMSKGAHWINNILVQRTAGDGIINNGSCTYELYYDLNIGWLNNFYNVATEVHYPSEGKYNVTWNHDQSEVTTLPGTQVVNVVSQTYDDSNQTLVPTGSADAPSYSFFAQRNTGMYGFTDNTIGFTANGTRMLSIKADGSLELRNDGSSQGASIQRVGQIQFTWDRDTYGNSNNHAIVCDSDNLIINSFDDVTINLDSNNNDGSETFDIRRHSTSLTGGELLFQISGSGTSYTMGASQVGNGSESAPSLSFYNDTNTGIYRKSEDYMAFVASGYERFAANGNGLDLSAGSVNKIVMPSSSTRDKYRLWNSGPYAIGMQSGFTFGGLGNNYAMTFQMNNQSDRGFWWGDDGHGQTSGAMALTTDGKLTLAHSLRIGYGESDTTTPGATWKLDVSGNGYVSGDFWLSSKLYSWSSGTGHVASMENNGTYLMMRNPEGNVGIYLGDTGDARNYYQNSSHRFRNYNDTQNYMEITSAGNVGINTISPYEKLQVKSPSSTSPAIVADGAAVNGCVNMAHGYAGQNGDYINTYGTQYSSGAMVLGYGVKPSTTANDTFLCSADNSNFTRGALVIDDELRFWQGAAANGTLNNNFSMTERFRLTAAGTGHFDGDVVAYSSTVSDKRLKENITTIDNALDKVMALRGVEYDWTATSRKGTHDIGLVAQEVEEVLPELVTEHELCTGEFGGEGNEKIFKTVNYDKMVGVLIEAIKEQQQQINELKEKLNG